MMKKLLSILFLFLFLFAGSGFTADIITAIDAVKFDTAGEVYTSSSKPTGGSHSLTIYNDVNATGDTTTMSLKIEVLASHDDTTYYILNDIGRFNKSITYTTTDVIETFNVDIIGHNFIKIKGTSAGCDTSANYYTTTVKERFNK